MARAAILIWTRVHGIVSLELAGVFDHHTVGAQRLIDPEIAGAIQSLRPVAGQQCRSPGSGAAPRYRVLW
ncbi:TetR-like C-terminal domain-containing protein [Streptomyces mirabilis]|uniref:TetR-like C-terminal domain-containing protein n=1 Tax=Streptomyces mirabilis TaxID=68239 RepID=UPI0036ED1B50